jgi:dTDP-glucose 4,6-dehydratase
MKVLITGGCGFIPSTLVRKFLHENCDVTVLDSFTYAGFRRHLPSPSGYRSQLDFFRGNIQNLSDVEACFQEYGPFDLVIHAAAESSVDRSIRGYEDFIKTNVLGTAHLFQICRENKTPKVINFLTDEIYGHFDVSNVLFHENDPWRPRNIYSASKAAQGMIARAFQITHGVPIINVCPANCYGPRQHTEKLIPKIIYCVVNNRAIPVYNGGQNIREWLYVEDAADAIYLLSKDGQPGEVYNLGTNEEKSVMAVIESVIQQLELVTGRKIETKIEQKPARPGDDFRYGVSTEKISRLGWRAKVGFDEGIRKTVEWFLDNQDFMNHAARRLNL